jgi:tRNA(fMet)-specific endonuclease VapC
MFLIDTNICIYLINGTNEKLRRRIESFHPYEIAVSAISVAELEYGVSKSRHIEQNRTTLHKFLSAFEILPFNDRDAESFGLIRAHLEKMGIPIGAYDMQIAAQGIARGIAVVTNNVREFERVPTLRVENWT